MHYIDTSTPFWIFHREDIETIAEGCCNAYFLIEGHTGYLLSPPLVVQEAPTQSELLELVQCSLQQAALPPQHVFISSNDPYVDLIAHGVNSVNLLLEPVPQKVLAPHVKNFQALFEEFMRGDAPPIDEAEKAALAVFIPGTYDPCPCASGKKYKFCCKPMAHEITEAMCAAEEGDLVQALYHMEIAEQKVGKTAEVLCRYAICWYFFDEIKAAEYLNKAYKKNKNHPRTNYLLGISAVAKKAFSDAINYYQNALDHYPKTDKYHRNETYNNLGTAFYESGQYQAVKEAWENGLILLPSDKQTQENLFNCIYHNPTLPESIRQKSPFVEKYLNKQIEPVV